VAFTTRRSDGRCNATVRANDGQRLLLLGGRQRLAEQRQQFHRCYTPGLQGAQQPLHLAGVDPEQGGLLLVEADFLGADLHDIAGRELVLKHAAPPNERAITAAEIAEDHPAPVALDDGVLAGDLEIIQMHHVFRASPDADRPGYLEDAVLQAL